MKAYRLLGLGVRLAVGGGRAAAVRLFLMAAGLAIGVALLLLASAVPAAIRAHDLKEAARYGTVAAERPGGPAALRWWAGTTFLGERVTVMVLQGRDGAPVPPGVSRLPRPGEVFASPALARLLGGEEGDLLRRRLPGRVVGTIGPPGLLEPDELVAYLGPSPDVALPWEPEVVTSFAPTARAELPPRLGVIVLLAVSVVMVLLPIALFVLTATRLSAATREARWAAIRLAGGTQPQVRMLAALETGLPAVGGLLLGFPLFLLLRPLGILLLTRGAGYRPFPSDVSPSLAAFGAAALAVPAFAIGASLLAMRRVVVSPLGIVRRARPRRAGAHWPAVLGAGFLGLLLCLARAAKLLELPSPLPAILVGGSLVLVLVGLAGTAHWLGWRAAGWVADRSVSPSVLLGARRLESGPSSAGLGATSVAVVVAVAVVVEGILLFASRSASASVPPGAVAVRPRTVVARSYLPPAQRLRVWGEVAAVPGVRSVHPSGRTPEGATCGRGCVALVGTDGRPVTVERVREVLGLQGEASTAEEYLDSYGGSDHSNRMLLLLALGSVLVILVTAGNLLVSTVDGIMERRRELAVLSAIGVPGSTLRRSVVVQVAVPLSVAVGLGMGAGLAVTDLLFRIVGEHPVLPVGLLLLTPLGAAAAVLLATLVALPWVRVVRRPELLRAE